MPIYLAWADNSIKGDVSDQKYPGWIELNSFQWGVGRGITSPTGSESDREGSTPSVSEIVVTKDQDSASPNLFRAACGTKPVNTGKTVHVAFAKTGTGGTSDTFLQFDLENTLVSGWSISSSGDRPTESLTLNFTKVTMTNTPTGPTLTDESPDRPHYDLAHQTGG
jgi:type VI secretion system secreted protein Hcp